MANSEIPKRIMSEMVAQYTLEPQLRDVYVEGEFDRDLYRLVLRERRLTDFDVVSIGDVELDPAVLLAYGLTDGKRQRVEALALELEKELKGGQCAVACVVDADLDHHLPEVRNCEFLLRTDYSTADVYLFDRALIDQILNTLVPAAKRVGRADSLVAMLEQTLPQLFAIRLVIRRFASGTAWIDAGKKAQKGRLEIDRFVEKLITKGAIKNRDEFKKAIAEQLVGLRGLDLRRIIHGDDFVSLFWAGIKHDVTLKGIGELHNVKRLMLFGFNVSAIKDEPLFDALCKRFARQGEP